MEQLQADVTSIPARQLLLTTMGIAAEALASIALLGGHLIGLTGRHEGSRPPRIPLMPDLSEKELDALVEEATVDAYGDDERSAALP